MADITKIALGQQELSDVEQTVVFECFIRRLIDHRNLSITYVSSEFGFSRDKKTADNYVEEINSWAKGLLKHAWMACNQPGAGERRSPPTFT